MANGAYTYDRAFVAALTDTAYRAGEAAMNVYETDFEVFTKADKSPVTAADVLAEAIILEDLARLAPSVPVIAEEKSAAGNIPETDALFFLVDPLDGTKEFLNKRGDFTVNIALIEHGVPIFGLVYAPALGQFYVTLSRGEAVSAHIERGVAALRLDALDLKPMRTRTANPGALTGVASRSHMTPETQSFLAAHNVQDTKNVGSSLKFCLVAAGEADVYPRFGPTKEWDTAAGHAVVNAAGGCVLLPSGEPLTYGKRDANYLNPNFIVWGRSPASER
ncbi:MAG: 3'(2'),5'-bisphosphate nucleotidase CysQ [Hyphomicrobiales bacterium]|nr:3'(2'),5'-bisphosphate nucleotidase CysQ [Hyphomicrobiales bacterium]